MKKYADSMFSNGTVRVGTLKYEYRQHDNKEVEDANEGKAIVHRYTEYRHYKTGDEMDTMLRGVIGIGRNAKNIIVHNNYIRKSINVENAYINCLLTNPNKAVMQKIEYDVCIEILDIREFAIRTQQALKKKSLYCSNDSPTREEKCIYVDHRNINCNDRLYAHWLKDKRFSHQSEFCLVYLLQQIFI
jgi:hypothetical protein